MNKRKTLVLAIVMSVVLLILLSVTALWIIGAGWHSQGNPIEIKDGFSAELRNALETNYEITIPDDAVFVKGFCTNALREPVLVILFELPLDANQMLEDEDTYIYICQQLKLDPSRYTYSYYDEEIVADWYEEMGGKLNHKIDDGKNPFTFLSYSLCEDKITIRFFGNNPGLTFD